MRKLAMLLLPAVALLGLFGAPWASGQTPPRSGARTPADAVMAYFNQILRPSLEVKPPRDEVFSSFYLSGLSDRTRAQLGEEQFAGYWKQMARRLAERGLSVSVSSSVGEPLPSEDGGQALLHVTGSALSLPFMGLAFLVVPINTILGCVPGLDPHRPSSFGCPPDSWPSATEVHGRFDAVYRVINEGEAWRLVLPEALVEDMRGLTPQVTLRRYAPNASVTQSRLTVRVLEVVLQGGAATVRLALDNANDVGVDVLNALSLASLAGEGGPPSRARILRSTIPQTVPAQSAAPAVLEFDPLPIETKRLFLSLPGIRLGENEFTMTLDVTLLPLPHAAIGDVPVSSGPVLLYLLTAFRPDFRSNAVQAAFYQRHLSGTTRSSVSERDFIDYYRSEGIDAWMCRLGLPDVFSIGPPAYDPGKTRAGISVSVAAGPRSSSTGGRSTVVAFAVVKEDHAWKLTLPDDVVANIRARPLVRRHLVAAAGSQDAISVSVTHVVLDQTSTTIHLDLWNHSDGEVGWEPWPATRLLNQRGVAAAFHRSTLPARLRPRSQVSGSLVFGPLPVESRELQLTVGRFVVRGSAVSLGLRIVLRSCP